MPANRRTNKQTAPIHAMQYGGIYNDKTSLRRRGATRVNLKNILSSKRSQTAETFYVSTEVLGVRRCMFVKIHPAVYLRSGHFTDCESHLNKIS